MLLLTNIGQLLTLRGPRAPRRKAAMADLGLMNDGAVLCDGPRIVAAGRRREVTRQAKRPSEAGLREVDCGGRVALPGLVDAHTHAVFAAPRLVDFEKRIAGANYEEIAQAGGGIQCSAAALQRTQPAQLEQLLLGRLRAMEAHGATTIEIKSGYGLELKQEVKSLEVVRAARAKWHGTIVPTLMAAHAVPRNYANKRAAYLRMVMEQMIPAAAAAGTGRAKDARVRLAEFVDVFCERGAFTLDETQRIFRCAEQHGLGARVHLGQLSRQGVRSLLPFKPASFDHMEFARPDEYELLAKSSSIVTLLPGADYFLGGRRYANARAMIEAGIAIALATDFNPGTSPTLSMPMVLSLACTQLRMSPAEAITAATINGAAALRLERRKGSLEQGKDADIAIFDVSDYREISYWFGENRCWAVVNKGRLRHVQ